MALFEIRKETGDVVLTRRKREGAYRQNELIDARAEVFDFMQDDTTRMVYKLHDPETSAELKLGYRGSLMQRGGNLSFEFKVQQLKVVIKKMEYLSDEDIRSIRNLIKVCFVDLNEQHQDEDMVLDCLLCIREILDRMPDLKLKPLHESIWEGVTERVIHTYTEEVFYIFLDIMKRMHGEEDLDERGYLSYIINNMALYPIGPVCAIIETFYGSEYDHRKWARWRFNKERRETIPEDYFDLFKHAKPKHVASFLKIFALSYNYPISDKILRQIEGKWDEYLLNEPEELVELLQVFLQLGRFNDVKRFLNSIGSRRLRIFFARSPEIAAEIISLAETVKADDAFFQKAFICLKHKNIGYYPQAFMEEIEYALSGKNVPTSIEELFYLFLKYYTEMLASDTDKAVRLLVTIAQKESYSRLVPLGGIYEACCMGMSRYPFILERSVNAAAHILSLTLDVLTNERYRHLQKDYTVMKNLDLLRDRFFAVYMTRCFDKALIIRDKENVNILIELLHRMDRDTKREMSEYFKEKYFYIKKYSGKIAAAIDQIYNWTRKGR